MMVMCPVVLVMLLLVCASVCRTSGIELDRTADIKLLLVVPGMSFKYKQSADILRRNIDIIEATKGRNIDYKCMVFVYDNVMPPFLSPNIWIPQCDFERYQEAGYGDNMKAVTPQLVKYAGFSHVMVLLDDILLQPNFSLERMFYYMARVKLTVAQPGIINAQVGRCIYQPSKNEGYMIQNLEIFAPIFDIPSWNCFWDLVDPKYNNRGLGYELFFYPRCVEQAKLRLGVVQNMSAAQVVRVKTPLPADYFGGSPVSFGPQQQQQQQQASQSSSEGLFSSFFGRDSGEGGERKGGAGDAAEAIVGEHAGSYSYHDERFLKVLDSCGDSLSSSCKKRLLQAYQEKFNYGRVEWAKHEKRFGRPMLEGTRTYHSRLFQNFGKPRKDKSVKYTDKDW